MLSRSINSKIIDTGVPKKRWMGSKANLVIQLKSVKFIPLKFMKSRLYHNSKS
jgi:hypothetical protein